MVSPVSKIPKESFLSINWIMSETERSGGYINKQGDVVMFDWLKRWFWFDPDDDDDSLYKDDTDSGNDFVTDPKYCFLEGNIYHDICDDHHDHMWDDSDSHDTNEDWSYWDDTTDDWDTTSDWDTWDDFSSSWDDDW